MQWPQPDTCWVQCLLLVSFGSVLWARHAAVEFVQALPEVAMCDAHIPAAFYGVGQVPPTASLQLVAAPSGCSHAFTVSPGVGMGVNGTATDSCLAATLRCIGDTPSSEATCSTSWGQPVSQSAVVGCFCREYLMDLAATSVWEIILPSHTEPLCDELRQSYLAGQAANVISAVVVSVVTTVLPTVTAGTARVAAPCKFELLTYVWHSNVSV